MSYKCDLCEKTFASLQGLQNHIKNKVCEKYKCDKCGQIYSCSTTYKYHLLHNVCEKHLISKTKIQLKSTQLQPIINSPELHDNFNNLTFDEYQKLCADSQKLKTQQIQNTQINMNKPQINININNNNNQYNTIIVPPAYLSMDTYENIIKRCPHALDHAVFKTPTDCIMDLVKSTNCNPDYPEFNSIMITNKKDGSARVSDGKKFKLVSRQNVITQLIDNKRLLIQRHIDNNPEKYSKISKKLENYMNIIEDDEQYKALETELIYELIAMKDVINSDKWTADLLNYLETNKSTEITQT